MTEVSQRPSVTFIVPVRPGNEHPRALPAIAKLDYPRELVEVVVVEGQNPSKQRNAAVTRASGELLYFCDDDSELEPDAMRRALEVLVERPDAASIDGVGGPVLTRPDDNTFQRAVGAAKSSVFGLGPYRHRFMPYGPIRPAGQQELISANLILRRSVIERVGGFDERMYGAEERELIERVGRSGARLFYHPLMCCRRSRRRTLRAVFAQNYHYGAGRIRHFLVTPRISDLMVLAPVGLLASIALAIAMPRWWTLAPVLSYVHTALLASVYIGAMSQTRKLVMFGWLLAIFPAMHIGYGLGMALTAVRALVRRPGWQDAKREVSLSVLPPPVSSADQSASSVGGPS